MRQRHSLERVLWQDHVVWLLVTICFIPKTYAFGYLIHERRNSDSNERVRREVERTNRS